MENMFHILKLSKITNKMINKISLNIIKKVNKTVSIKFNMINGLIKLVITLKLIENKL
jgi:hypothetical protein